MTKFLELMRVMTPMTVKLPNKLEVDGVGYKLKIFKPHEPVWGNVVFMYKSHEADRVLAAVNGQTTEEAREKLAKALVRKGLWEPINVGEAVEVEVSV